MQLLQNAINAKNATAQISTNITPKLTFAAQQKTSPFAEMLDAYRVQKQPEKEKSSANALPEKKAEKQDTNVKEDVVLAKTAEQDVSNQAKLEETVSENKSDALEEDFVSAQNYFSKKTVDNEALPDENLVIVDENVASLAVLNSVIANEPAAGLVPAGENFENQQLPAHVEFVADVAENQNVAVTQIMPQRKNNAGIEAKVVFENDAVLEVTTDVETGVVSTEIIEIATGASTDSGTGDGNLGSKNDQVAKTWKFDNDGKITVTDFRTQVAQADTQAVSAQGTSSSPATDDAHKKTDSTNVNTVQMSLNLAQTAEQNILANNTQIASAHGSDFQAMLTNQISENAGEFVKAGSIVLRDGNVGEINLTLNPEKLGNVKISLQLSDKVIAGQITVASREAYEAFKSSAETLRQAFIQSGFEMNGLDVAWAGQNAANSFAERQDDSGKQFAASRAYGDYVADSTDVSDSVNDYGAYESYTVNVTA